MNFIKKQNVFGWILCAGTFLAFVSWIIYLVNSTTGYLASEPTEATPIVLPILVIIGSIALWLFSDKLDDRLVGLASFVLCILMAFATMMYIVDRVDVIGDLLNPVNHPAAQISAVNVAIAGIVMYLVTFIVYVVATIGGRLTKKNV